MGRHKPRIVETIDDTFRPEDHPGGVLMATNVTETMELTQAVQTLKWLDTERRKDKAAIAALQEHIQEQDRKLAEQAAQIQDLQDSLAGVQGVLSRVNQFETMVSNYKAELVHQMDQRAETRRKEMVESERVRQIEYKTITDNLNTLERELRVLPRYDDELRTCRAEDQRLSEALQRLEVAVADLDTRSDERVKAVTYLEEQRRADNRRITDLERDTTALHKRIETIVPKLPLLEETLQKQRTRIEEAIQETKKYEKPIEELRISDFQREQKMKQYLNQAEQVNEEMERIRTQTQSFLEHQQMVKRALKKLEGFQARLEKRQNEVAEMQRVASDRIKRQWEEWEEEQARQKKKQDVVTEERWRQQAQTNDAYVKHLKALRSTTELHQSQLDTLWETRRADATDVLKAVQDVYESLMAPIDEQLAILRGEQQE